MTPVSAPDHQPTALADRELLERLRSFGSDDTEAVRRLRAIIVRAASHQIRRMPRVWSELGPVRAEEIVESAADQATVDVLAHLNRFEGRSRFSTWVFKFGIWHAAGEAQRALWRDRPVALDDGFDLPTADPVTPSAHVEHRDLAAAVSVAMNEVLTAHQRRVARALILEEVPIDVLAQALGTNRNAVYKTLHDARIKLRKYLEARCYFSTTEGSDHR